MAGSSELEKKYWADPKSPQGKKLRAKNKRKFKRWYEKHRDFRKPGQEIKREKEYGTRGKRLKIFLRKKKNLLLPPTVAMQLAGVSIGYGYNEMMQEIFLPRIKKERDRLMQEMSSRSLEEVGYKDMAAVMDVLQKNVNLIEGKPTAITQNVLSDMSDEELHAIMTAHEQPQIESESQDTGASSGIEGNNPTGDVSETFTGFREEQLRGVQDELAPHGDSERSGAD